MANTAGCLGKIRQMSVKQRGILKPEAIGQAFSLDHTDPPPDLADTVDRHWIVRWDLRDRGPFRSEVLTHPAVHIVFEPHGCLVYGVRRKLDVRTLSGTGFAVGTKFLPGGFSAFTDRPISELTDRVLPISAILGPDAKELETAGDNYEHARALLGSLMDVLRGLRRDPSPDADLVNAVVADMREAEPGTRVSEIADRHAVSARTLQRLFARYVGVGPKWVLQRYRLHEALESFNRSGHSDWSRLALDLGYFDHAHFIRDFRAVVGRTPRQYGARGARGAVAAIPTSTG